MPVISEIEENILEFLKKKQDYVSGEEISQKLGISRQALWKHTIELKEAGYEIAAVPHLGYRLENIPDRLYPHEIARGLNNRFVGRKIFYFDSISSTNDEAMALGLKDQTEGALVVSESQTRGKGRMGRSWVSPKHKGIYFSLLLKPEIPPLRIPLITLLSAVAVCKAIGKINKVEPRIKWPNDILINGRKAGGILTELKAETDTISFVVIGVGLNVNSDLKSLPDSSTSLKEAAGSHVDRLGLLQDILRQMEELYQGFKSDSGSHVLEEWRSCNDTVGRRVKIILQKEHIEGQAVDIDSDGALVVRLDNGVARKIYSGDITHCR